VTFDPCEDCGSPLVPLVFFTVILWSGPLILGALRRHNAFDSEWEARLAKAHRLAMLMATVLTASAILR
jgi:hypothetical protein